MDNGEWKGFLSRGKMRGWEGLVSPVYLVDNG